MDDTLIPITVIILYATLLGLVAVASYEDGYTKGADDIKQEAIKNGVARYIQPSPKHSWAKFTWKKPRS